MLPCCGSDATRDMQSGRNVVGNRMFCWVVSIICQYMSVSSGEARFTTIVTTGTGGGSATHLRRDGLTAVTDLRLEWDVAEFTKATVPRRGTTTRIGTQTRQLPRLCDCSLGVQIGIRDENHFSWIVVWCGSDSSIRFKFVCGGAGSKRTRIDSRSRPNHRSAIGIF